MNDYVPKGRLNSSQVRRLVLFLFLWWEFSRPFRDLMNFLHDPTLERVGYFQISLREMTDEPPFPYE